MAQDELRVSVQCARHLPAGDSNGSSDPYVVIKIGDTEIGRTETIKGTLDPTWAAGFSHRIEVRS